MQNVSIVILNWEGLELLKECIPSVIKAIQKYQGNCEIIVVDNGSKDKSIDYLRSTFPKIRIISLPENIGFSKGMNRGIKASKNRIVIGLNNDTIAKEDFIKPLVRHFSSKDVFAVGAKIPYWDRESLAFGKATGRFRLGLLKIRFKDVPKTSNSLYACGAAAAFDKEKFLQLDGFDEEMNYWCDTDLCYRAWKSGWKSIFEPESIVCHKEESTYIKKYGKSETFTLFREGQFFFLWNNIRDKWLLFQHILFLPFLVLVALCMGRLYFVKGLFRTLKKLKLILKKRRREKKGLITDREVIRRCALE